MSKEPELKPCAHCGSDESSPIESVVHLCHNEWHPEHNPGGDWWTVQCDNCTATMGQFASPDEAIEAWNTRAPKSPPPEEQVEAVARAIRAYVVNEPEDRWQIPVIQFINNRDDELARAAISAGIGSGVGEMREALERIANGDVPRPIGKKWREDGAPSKNDKCVHDRWMYDDCGQCIEDFADKALEGVGHD